MTLYLKYRPQKVSELDLVSVRQTLEKLLQNEDIPHAFLFTGPRGTGKTSSARILAKALLCENKQKGSFEPCNTCDSCISIAKGTYIDVIEMDAASNRGIEEIRALKHDLVLAPSQSTKKIYIIDEVHMLTTEAANALLKTLEEPPAHVVFILATTDPQKLPQTVISRLSVVQFSKASIEEISQKLKLIAEAEKFSVEDGVFEKIAQAANGSFRDAVKMLEEFALGGKIITNAQLEEQVYVGGDLSHELLTKLLTGDETAVALFIEQMGKRGMNGKTFLNAFITEVHTELLKSVGLQYASKNKIEQSQAVVLLELLLEAKSRLAYSPDDFLPLQIALVKFHQSQKKTLEKKEQPLPHSLNTDKTIAVPTPKPMEVIKDTPQEPQKVAALQTPVPPATTDDHVVKEDVIVKTAASIVSDLPTTWSEDMWSRILSQLKAKNGGVEALLRAGQPRGFDGKVLTIGLYFQFHKERLETPSCKTVFEEVLNEFFGNTVKVTYALEEPPQRATPEYVLTDTKEPAIINAAKEIFG